MDDMRSQELARVADDHEPDHLQRSESQEAREETREEAAQVRAPRALRAHVRRRPFVGIAPFRGPDGVDQLLGRQVRQHGREGPVHVLPLDWIRNGVYVLGKKADGTWLANHFSGAGVCVCVCLDLVLQRMPQHLVLEHNFSDLRATLKATDDADFEENCARLVCGSVQKRRLAMLALQDSDPATMHGNASPAGLDTNMFTTPPSTFRKRRKMPDSPGGILGLLERHVAGSSKCSVSDAASVLNRSESGASASTLGAGSCGDPLAAQNPPAGVVQAAPTPPEGVSSADSAAEAAFQPPAPPASD